MRILCECGREDCDRVIAITLAEYESVRADPRRFAVAHAHVLADLEQVVAQTDRYAVVAKREGTPGGGGGRGGPARLAALPPRNALTDR